jgi:hypothetical protein
VTATKSGEDRRHAARMASPDCLDLVAATFWWNLANLTPTCVSFTKIQVRENGGQATGTGVLAGINGDTHPTSPWSTPANPNVQTGCQLTSWHDQIAVSSQVAGVGEYDWPAIWQYEINNNTYDFSSPVSQSAYTTVAGTATVYKARHSESAKWADSSSTPPGW